MPRPDARTNFNSRGESPDFGHMPDFRAVARDRSVRQLRDVENIMRAQIDPKKLSGARNYVNAEDAVADLGLAAEARRKARVAIDQVARDAVDLLVVTKSLKAAGVDRRIVGEIIRRGVALQQRYAREGELVKGGLPDGTKRTHGGKKVVKRGGKWVPDRGTGDPKERVTTGRGTTTRERQQNRDKAKASTAKRKKEQETEPPASEPTGDSVAHPEVRSRYESLKKRAADVKVRIKGSPGPNTTHDHLDKLEQRLAAHEKAYQAEGHAEEPKDTPEAQTGQDGLQTGKEEAPTEEPKADAGHDKPEAPHQAHALQQEAHDVGDELRGVEGRLDSSAQQAMHKELLKENAAVRKNPSPQAIQWHRTRVKAFLTLLGAVAGAAAGTSAVGGALAGGVEGQASQVDVAAQANQAQEAARKKAAEPEEKPDTDDKKVKKSLVIVGGRLFIKSMPPGDTTDAKGAPVEDPTEDVPEPVERPVGFKPIGTAINRAFGVGVGTPAAVASNPVVGGQDTIKAKGRRPPPRRVQKAALPIGHVSTRQDGSKWRKVGPDKWAPVSDASHHAAKPKVPAGPPKPLTEADGRSPLTLYQANDSSTMHTTPEGGSEYGIFLTPRRNYAQLYGRNLHRTYAQLRNPKVVENKGEISPKDLTKEDIDRLKAQGYDGIVVKNPGSPDSKASEIVVFDASALIPHDPQAFSAARNKRVDWEYDTGLRKSARATRSKNEYGHRDGLVPGMQLKAKGKHGGMHVEVLSDGCFGHSGAVYQTPSELLHALHGHDRHNTTMRRYFGLGEERKTDTTIPELRALFKSDRVLVQSVGGEAVLTGDLAKANVPAHFLPYDGAQTVTLDREAAQELITYKRSI